MREIKVPRVPKRAFNKNRPASDLLRRQVEQLRHVVAGAAGAAGAAGVPEKRVRTEGQVAQFVASVTRLLHPEGHRPAAGTTTPKSGKPKAPATPRRRPR